MNIGIDLDGVLLDSIPYWVRVLNREAGANFQTGEFPDTSADPLLAACEREHELEMVVAPPPMSQAVPVLTHHRLTTRCDGWVDIQSQIAAMSSVGA